jgi:hypothetical protein
MKLRSPQRHRDTESVKKYTYAIGIKREGGEYYAYSEDFAGVYGLGNSIEEAKASILESVKLTSRKVASTIGCKTQGQSHSQRSEAGEELRLTADLTCFRFSSTSFRLLINVSRDSFSCSSSVNTYSKASFALSKTSMHSSSDCR